MDIKFQGTIQLVDGQNTYTFYLPDKGSFYGRDGINTKDLARRIYLTPSQTETINLGATSGNVLLAVITDADITLTVQTSAYISALPIKADQILTTDRKFGLFITTVDVGSSNSLEIASLTESANIDVYIASAQNV